MLHHYNYSSPLSHFLYGPQHQHQVVGGERDSSECSPGQTTPTSVCAEELGHGHKAGAAAANKSFTIAAILGLKDAADRDGREDLTAVVNLSVHQGISERGGGGGGGLVSDCSRLQLPVMRHSVATAASVPYPPPTSQHHQRTVRSLKHVPGGGGGGGGTSTSPSTSKKSSNSKSKRVRTIFTPEQLERLEAEFERQQYMVGPERLYLAHTLQLTEAQVKVWFQNRRIKWRKHHLEITHQRLAAIKQQQLQQQLLTDHNTDTLDSNNSDDNTTDTT